MPAMSHSEEAVEVENCEFKWGKKRRLGGKRKEVQFYDSFTYDGVEYFLYDCVYLHKEGEPEPYIGKLVKIWEQPKKIKKVKVLWFFRPVEILNWLGDDLPLENELFLASGEGVGLANVNFLEAIAGKCNVICTSKDNRNPQPSEEELDMADYVFYRTFDVGNCTISDKINEEVAGIEVRFIFNRKDVQKPSYLPDLDMEGKEENHIIVENNEASKLSSKLNSSGELKNVVTDDKPCHSVEKGDADLKSLVETLPEETSVSTTGAELKETPTAGDKQRHVAEEVTITRRTTDSENLESKAGNIPISQVEEKEKIKAAKDAGAFDHRPSKKARVDRSVKSSEELQPNISSSLALGKVKNGNSLQKKLIVDSTEDGVKAVGTTGRASEDERKSKLVKDPLRHEKGPPKNAKPDEKEAKLSNGTLPKETGAHAQEEGTKPDGQVLEATRRPDADRSKWFKGLPWEERMQTAHEQGSLVLLENLDPAYTSADIEETIWHGFRESCTAKMIQRTAMSSPYSGQAFVIFKTREAAEMAIRKLNEGCLLLPNGRPIVGSKGTPSFLGKPSSFAGHIFIDKVKLLTQREEMKQAVSTSHYSQPNTIEYEMAMEWRLLQTRSDSWWRELYKQHGDELRKHRVNSKLK